MNRIEINVLTGEKTVIPLSEEEIANNQSLQIAENEKYELSIALKNSALSKLSALGLTDDEIKALVG